ncbi:MAG: cobalamin-dependent protein [Deltaproteobacteria bacterium]|nr:cobalamin-dependent protein [Deltaproteobacteria bacterium]
MKLLLIQPSQIIDGEKVCKTKRLMFPRLSLPYLASLTPPEIQVEIIDEYFEEIPFDDPADLIGISFMTPQAPRAYQIGDEFKKRGRKVVMGGIHASALPEEAMQYADAVVVGEAEGIWSRVLEDFKNGRMNGIYRSPQFPELTGLPIPRYDLLKKERYRLFNINFPIQAGRGCPFKCEFCSVTRFYGGKYRFRPVGEVVREIQQTRFKKIFFVDDNIISNRGYACELFQALIPWKLRRAGKLSLI